MDNQEKSSRSIENRESLKELKEIAEQQQERIDNAKEKEATTPERQAEKLKEARREALETAAKAEKRERNLLEKDKKTSPERRKGPISKKERDKAFDATMREVQSQMSAPSRAFSKVIHNKVIEKPARSSAILSRGQTPSYQVLYARLFSYLPSISLLAPTAISYLAPKQSPLLLLAGLSDSFTTIFAC